MKHAVTNLASPVWARAAALVLPALLSLFALAGVTAGPMVGIAEASLDLRAAQARADVLELERAELDRFQAAQGFERAAGALSGVRGLVPASLGPVQAFGCVRLTAERLGLELERLEIGGVEDLGLEGPHDRIAAQVVRLGGEGRLAELVALVAGLRGLGLVTAVRDLSLRRESPEDPRFHFLITLGLLHFAPLEAEGATLPSSEAGA